MVDTVLHGAGTRVIRALYICQLYFVKTFRCVFVTYLINEFLDTHQAIIKLILNRNWFSPAQGG